MKRDQRIQEVTREEAEKLGGIAEPAISEADALASMDDDAESEDDEDADEDE